MHTGFTVARKSKFYLKEASTDMKIEKVNEQQIRCTLTREDLLTRELKISELAYGTEKAKNLFRDLMQQAAYECGFEAEDIPLMIEAIPLNAECIVLIVTKVEDPEELDTRFAKFAPSIHDDDFDPEENESNEALMEAFADSADEVLNLLRRMNGMEEVPVPSRSSSGNTAKPSLPEKEKAVSRLYSFRSLREITRLAKVLGSFRGTNVLYKDEAGGNYLLLVTPGEQDTADYNRLCSLISEYGRLEKTASATRAYLEEHFEPLIRDNAVETLAKI